MEKTLIIKEGDFAIYRLEEPTFGGHYAVVNHRDRTAKTGLCLDAAFEVFRALTCQAAIYSNLRRIAVYPSVWGK